MYLICDTKDSRACMLFRNLETCGSHKKQLKKWKVVASMKGSVTDLLITSAL